jgi:hypothetical protein
MRMMFSVALALGLAFPAAHGTPPLPKDVKEFLFKRESCEHFLGEIPDPGEKARMREVNKAIKDTCTGTDKALAALKKKYAREPAVMTVLKDLDPQLGI